MLHLVIARMAGGHSEDATKEPGGGAHFPCHVIDVRKFTMITCLFSTENIFISFLPEKVIDVVSRSCVHSFICIQFRHEVIQIKLWLGCYFSMRF